jgi:hypothetical protein
MDDMKMTVLKLVVVFVMMGIVLLYGCTQSVDGGRQLSSLPSLVVDKDSPLLLDELSETDKLSTEAEAQNTTCYVCHANYAQEPLTQWHAKENMACSGCHGESIAHKNDENNTTPPDKMYPAGDIDRVCQKCHPGHDVQPAKVVSRWKERIGDDKTEVLCKECHESHDIAAAKVVRKWQKQTGQKKSEELIVCTDCHGQHRLKMRSVRWDKKSGELLRKGN